MSSTRYEFLIQQQVLSSTRVLAGLIWVLLGVSVAGGKGLCQGLSAMDGRRRESDVVGLEKGVNISKK